MIKILIVEDESRAAKRLEKLIRKATDDRDLQICHERRLDSALGRIETVTFDLLFLDLNLKGESGFDILKQVVSHPFHTIIVSAYVEKALEAFEYGVLDFVPKPVMPDRLQKALDRFYTRERTPNNANFLTVKRGGALELIPIATIKYIHADHHYSALHLNDGSYKLHDKSLEKLLMILPSPFERCHKSYIVNMDNVKEVRSFIGSRYEVELKDGIVLPLGRSRSQELKNKLLHRG